MKNPTLTNIRASRISLIEPDPDYIAASKKAEFEPHDNFREIPDSIAFSLRTNDAGYLLYFTKHAIYALHRDAESGAEIRINWCWSLLSRRPWRMGTEVIVQSKDLSTNYKMGSDDDPDRITRLAEQCLWIWRKHALTHPGDIDRVKRYVGRRKQTVRFDAH